MATADSVKTKLQGLIDKSNRVTGSADATLTDAVGSLIAGFGQGGGDVPAYTGEYEVTPKAVDQTLPTAGMRMTDDVIIQKITYSSVSNESGGDTIIFGG